jgi:hypothetical protein
VSKFIKVSETAIWLKYRLKDLLALLKVSSFVETKSTIVYCKFQLKIFFGAYIHISTGRLLNKINALEKTTVYDNK